MGNIAFSRGYELANWNKIVARRDKRLTTEKKKALLAQMSLCIASNCYRSMKERARERKHKAKW